MGEVLSDVHKQGAVEGQLVEVSVEELREQAAGDLDFYHKGLSDYVGGRHGTPAAIGFIAYWKPGASQS